MVLRLSGKEHLRLERAAGATVEVLDGRVSVTECGRAGLVLMLRFGALAAAIGVTCTIVWALSSYGYPSADAGGSPALAAKVARAGVCL